MHDVLIIGSGVIGMSIARQLSQLHLDIAIVDRDIPGMHASYKAGGMLGAQNEFTTDSELFQLAVASRSLFPELSDALYHETGIDIEFQQSGLIKMASSTKDVERLTQQYDFLRSKDPSVELLSDDALFNLSNGHIEPTDLAIYIPKDGQINANHYTKALLQSVIQRGVHRYYQTEVQHIHHNNGYYTVTTHQSDIHAKKVIVAGGAWSTQLLKDYAIPRQVIGVKGEVLLVEQPSLKLNHTVFMTNGCYIVPKEKHRYLIGATSEFNNYSVGNSEVGISWLLKHAQQRIPELSHSHILKQWSGIRPYTEHELPIMDQIDDGLFIITGHYRNGILLSPIIGQDIANWLLSGIKPAGYSAFSLSRSEQNEVYH